MTAIEERLHTVRFRTDDRAHIQVDAQRCTECPHRACVPACPAGLYRYGPHGLEYTHAGCLECGTCLVVCDRRAIAWEHPDGGMGVCLRFG
jgi:ferredoxin like protein